jgi:hypothetical protein
VDTSKAQTTRQRFAAHTSAPFCSGCHGAFDPMGNAFESYDGIGRYRTTENGVAIDSSGAIVGTTSSDGPVADAVGLTRALAASPDVYECFARQVFRFDLGRRETDADDCAIKQQTKVFVDNGLDMRELLIAIATSPAFAVRSVPKAP